jgi:hypothetical protein
VLSRERRIGDCNHELLAILGAEGLSSKGAGRSAPARSARRQSGELPGGEVTEREA